MEQVTQMGETLVRLIIPYKDIFTTVYLIKSPQGAVLFDTADCERDVAEDILPMLAAQGIDDLKYIFISHGHRDHAGGLEWVLKRFPNACVVSRSEMLREKYPDTSFLVPKDGDVFGEYFRVVTIPGHTLDSMALLDTRTGTLITGDCLQLYGIFGSTDWACAIYHPALHLQALDKVRGLDVQCVLTAHDYHPMGNCYHGRQEIQKALDACAEPLLELRDIIAAQPELDDEGVRQHFNARERRPTVSVRIVAAMRKGMGEGGL